MNPEDLPGKNFLDELYRLSKGDPTAQVSMYEVGESIGMSKGEAGSLAESLIVEGLVELKTLAGGVGITKEGLATLGVFAIKDAAAETELHFSEGPVADVNDLEVVMRLIRQVKEGISSQPLDYSQLEEVVIDLKTLEVHLLSPRPKVEVLRALLRSLYDALGAADLRRIAAKLLPLLD